MSQPLHPGYESHAPHVAWLMRGTMQRHKPRLNRSLLELDPQPRAVEPHDLAGPPFPVRDHELEGRGYSVSCLHLQAGSGLGEAAHGAWDAPAAEKNLPGFEHSHALGVSALVHWQWPVRERQA